MSRAKMIIPKNTRPLRNESRGSIGVLSKMAAITAAIMAATMSVKQMFGNDVFELFISRVETVVGNYMIPRSRSANCHFQAESIVSASERSAFHPRILLALDGSPQTLMISPSRRGPNL